MPQILLVGNSSSVLDCEAGEKIDSFPGLVCRFNNFRTQGFENFVGTRTDWLARRACDDVFLYHPENLKKVLAVVTWCRYTSGMRAVAEQLRQHYGKLCEVVEPWQTYNYAEDIGYPNDLATHPTIGILTIYHILSAYPEYKITLHGFDGDDLSSKYFAPGKDSHFHNLQLERTFIKNLNLPTLENPSK